LSAATQVGNLLVAAVRITLRDVKEDKIIGIMSRNNLVQALVSTTGGGKEGKAPDRPIRLELLSSVGEQAWTDFGSRNVTLSATGWSISGAS
jgi:hypothetical protein